MSDIVTEELAAEWGRLAEALRAASDEYDAAAVDMIQRIERDPRDPEAVRLASAYANAFEAFGNVSPLAVTTLLADRGRLTTEVVRLQELFGAALAAVDGVDVKEGHVRDNADPDQLRKMLLGLGVKLAASEAENAALRARLCYENGRGCRMKEMIKNYSENTATDYLASKGKDGGQ